MIEPKKELATQVSELVQPDERSTGMSTQSARAIAEVQGMMALAKRFPRDENEAHVRIMRACKRRALAETAAYQYPKGGQTVTGPSIRLAEALAQNWGNMDTGIIELERKQGESTAMAFAVDLETNYRKSVIFTVPHEIGTKAGVKRLTDARDIYETVMNSGSRRLRNCILAVIPGDVIDEAEKACDETLKQAAGSEPIQDRIRNMATHFDSFNVTGDMIAKKFGCKLESLSEVQLAQLRKIAMSLKDGVGKVSDFFEQPKSDTGAELQAVLKPTEKAVAADRPPGAVEAVAAKSAVPTSAPVTPNPQTSPKTGSFDDTPTTLFGGGKDDPRNVK